MRQIEKDQFENLGGVKYEGHGGEIHSGLKLFVCCLLMCWWWFSSNRGSLERCEGVTSLLA